MASSVVLRGMGTAQKVVSKAMLQSFCPDLGEEIVSTSKVNATHIRTQTTPLPSEQDIVSSFTFLYASAEVLKIRRLLH